MRKRKRRGGKGKSEVFSSDEGRTLEEVDEEQGKYLLGVGGSVMAWVAWREREEDKKRSGGNGEEVRP